MKHIPFLSFLHTKNFYFLLILLVSGICCGSLLVNYLTPTEISSLSLYMTTVSDISFETNNYFVTQVFINSAFILLICCIGYSLFALPLLAFIMFTKGVQIGFSSAVFWSTYQLKGIIGIILTLLPQVIFDLIAFILIAVVSLENSFDIIKCCIYPQQLGFSKQINDMLSSVIISLLFILISSFIKSTCIITLMEWFNML